MLKSQKHFKNMQNKIILGVVVLAVLVVGFAVYSNTRTGPTIEPAANAPAAGDQTPLPQAPTPEAPMGGNSPEASPAAPEIAVDVTAGIEIDTAPTTRSFTITGSDFAFEPKTITVNNGDTVRITLDNKKGFHDLVIDEFQVATKKLQAGQKDVVEFTADKVGTFEFYCSVGEHRAMGMKGTLVVK